MFRHAARMRFLACAVTAVALCAAMTFGASASALVTINDEPTPLATSVLVPASGSNTVSGQSAVIDVTNAAEGYVMCKYSGSASKIKVQVTKSGGTTYTYNLNTGGRYEVFPLTSGDGSYDVSVFENVSGNQYALACNTSVSVTLRNAFLPFLYPSQYVNFSSESATVKKGEELARGTGSSLATVEKIYNYVITNITYDNNKATTIQGGGLSGYLPAVDTILSSGKGICFDYAAVMSAMLRSQGIPTQLRVGYVTGGIYHAWISVYLAETGWVNNLIYFDGASWRMMDPTFASNAKQSAEIMKFIGNGANYSTMYVY